MRATEYATLSERELRRRDTDSNGLDRQAAAELRRRQLRELTGAGRDPRELLALLERRKNGPDLRSPAEKLLWLEARRHVTARGVDPRQLVLQMHAMRIVENYW
jgi:hypothetical protein